MVIYPPNSSRAKFEQPKWAQDTTTSPNLMQNTTSPYPSRLEQWSPDFEYQPSLEKSTSTVEGEVTYTTKDKELSKEVIERETDRANAQYISEVTQAVYTWRQLALHQ